MALVAKHSLKDCKKNVIASHVIAREPLNAAELQEAIVPFVARALSVPGEADDNNIGKMCSAIAKLECSRQCCKDKNDHSIIDPDARKWLAGYVRKREWRAPPRASSCYENVKRYVLKIFARCWMQQEGQEDSTADRGVSQTQHQTGVLATHGLWVSS